MTKKLNRVVITRFGADNFKTKFAAEVKGFIATEYFRQSEVRKYDLFTKYAVAATDEAVRHANLRFEKPEMNRIGVIWGSGNGGMQTMQIEVKAFFGGDGNPRFIGCSEWKQQFNLPLRKAQTRKIRYGMNNSFGFGGHVATSIFKNL